MPIPPLFVRLKMDPVNGQVVREVIDGQQRIRAVLGFVRGEYSLMKSHNSEYGDKFFSQLPEEARKIILSYKFHVNTIEDISDSEVLSLFARLNTYTVKLNDQELRNAQFFGPFKQFIYSLAHEYYNFWTVQNILSDSTIARMGDAELVSELIVTMMEGLRQTKSKDLVPFYTKYDDEFLLANELKRKFDNVMALISEIYGDLLRNSPFRRAPLFYSLYGVLFDAKFGFKDSGKPKLSFDSHERAIIRQTLIEIGEIVNQKEPSLENQQFVAATRLSTSDAGKKKLRHEFIWEKILQKINA